ncbi:MAG: protein-export membrane protein SecD [Acidobacteria bacterium RIFCSPLOWO2_12_FULL_66_10]|nr:MAG: protein-export membrane protein SecD [Acidobacteria bacterium RIFCSPLOWO2_12_FULL_66_10]
MSNLRWKVLTVLGVFVVFAGLGVYPILAARYHIPAPGWLMDKQLKLGLDLKGGVHLVLRVQTDDALRLETDTEMERLRSELETRKIPVTNVVAVNVTQFRVEGVQPGQDAAFRQAATEVQVNFDRSSGTNGTYTFTLKPNIQVNLRDESVVQARQTIERRVNELGVTEPSITQQGSGGDQILVQLPGVTDVERAKQIMGSPGLLELKIVEQGPSPTKEALTTGGQVPQGMEVVPGAPGVPGEPAGTVYYLVKRVAAVTGRDLRNARASLDENNQPAVSFTLHNEGGARFGKVTAENIGRQLAIVLDGRVQSAPRIESRISTDGRITGSFTSEEVQNLSLILRSGALPATLTYLEERTIGPSLGADSIRSGVLASFVGLLFVVLFMLVYYKLSGVNAVVALVFNLVILLGLMAYIGAVMTLPGIAGFVLTMGMGVDSNVLIFERIKEELEAQRGVRAAINAGFARVFWTLVDTHTAALISAAFLFQFGTGPIRGFAVTLFVGLVSNLFTSTFVSKTLFELALARKHQVATLSI